MATTISARNSSIELLRIFTMASVLMGHSFGHGAHGEVSYDGLFLLWGVCINVFLLISGYYGINLRVKSFLNLTGMVLFYHLLSSVLNIVIFRGGVNVNHLISAFLPISHNYFYWFIACYLMLMLLSPLLNKGLQALSNGQLLFTMAVMIYINCISGWLFKNGLNSNGFNTMQMIFMYVIGYGLHRFDAEKSGKMWLLLMAYAMLSVINMLITDYLPDRFGGYNNPFVVAKSVVVFCIFLRVHFQSKTVNRIAACVFPCYLLQDGAAGFSFYDVQYGVWQSLQNSFGYLGFVIVCTVCIFALAMLLEPIRKRVMSPLNDRIYTILKLHRIDEVLRDNTKS